MPMTPEYNAALGAIFAKNGWNPDRVYRSFSNKGGYQVLRTERDGRFCIEIAFQQTRLEAYGFKVCVALRLARSMDSFDCFLFTEDNYRPLHEPVTIPVMYGFTAQVNQMHRAVSGLEYVYRVAGVEGLEYFPNGKHEPCL